PASAHLTSRHPHPSVLQSLMSLFHQFPASNSAKRTRHLQSMYAAHMTAPLPPPPPRTTPLRQTPPPPTPPHPPSPAKFPPPSPPNPPPLHRTPRPLFGRV